MSKQEPKGRDRVEVGIELDLRFADIPSLVRASGENVSTGGMFVATEELKPTGTRLRFRFTVGDGTKVGDGFARVVWVREAGAAGPAGMGVRFEELDPFCHEIIDTIMRMGTESGDRKLDPEVLKTELLDRSTTYVLTREEMQKAMAERPESKDQEAKFDWEPGS